MRHGEVWWVELPDRGGREQRGRRPAIVWQDTNAFPLPTVLTIPFTSQMEAARFPGTVLVRPSRTNGLRTDSLALVFQLGSFDADRFEKRIGKLSEDDIRRIRDIALRLQKMV